MVHVPYKSDTSALVDLVAGRVQLMFGTLGVLAPAVTTGKLRAVAVLGPRRSPVLPEVPTLSEASVPPFGVVPSVGAFGPAKLPPEVVERLNGAINGALRKSEVRAQMDRQGLAIETSTPEELAAFMRHQYDAWGRAVHEAGIKPA